MAKILERIPDRDNWCVEFGAWDGLHLSNTRSLILNQAYSAVLIESDRQRYAALQQNYRANPKVTALCAMVGTGPQDGLDALLSRTEVPTRFDMLSIDIDGFDYLVWQATVQYQPKVVCIEFNPTIPIPLVFVQPANTRTRQGSSLCALVQLGKAKGYELAFVSTYNAIFVRTNYFELLEIPDNSPDALWTDRAYVTYIFSGYDGRIHLAGLSRLPWHAVGFDARDLQVLPWWLRQYPEDMPVIKKVLLLGFRAWRLLTHGRRRQARTH